MRLWLSKSSEVPILLQLEAQIILGILSNDLKAGQRLPSTLRSRSVSESLQGEKPPPADALIAIVSCWPEFLRWSHTILVAAGVDPNALNFRDAREKGWEKGLRSTAFVITDSLMARHLPAGCDARVFRV